MKKTSLFFKALLVAIAAIGFSTNSKSQIITTIAGNGTAGFSGDGGAATSAELRAPADVAFDGGGNMYIADHSNNCIRKVTTAGIMSTIAGDGYTGGTGGYSGDGGPATAAQLSVPSGVAVDASGNVYISDGLNSRIRVINTSGIITTFAGTGTSGYSGDGGAASSAEINDPGGIRFDASGNLYIADAGNNVIRKISTSGTISTFAGNHTAGFSGDGGAATAAELYSPNAIAFDASGNLYISDQSNDRIRKVTTSGIISTFAGNGSIGFSGDGGAATGAELYNATGVVADASGNVYIADAGNYRLRKVNTSGIISTFAGTGTAGYSGDGGAASAAELYSGGMVFDASGNLYLADGGNQRIRKVTAPLPASSCTPAFLEGDNDGLFPLCNASYPLKINGASSTSLTDAYAISTTCYSASCMYTDQTATSGMTSLVLNAGSTYTCTAGNPYSESSMSYQAWIDFNNNGAFETSESVGGVASPSGTTPTFSIVVPSGVSAGSFRMRVEDEYEYHTYPSLSPCPTGSAPYYYGEVRDYKVTIGAPTAVFTATPDTLLFGCVLPGSTSSVLSSSITGTYLSPSSGNVTLTAPTDFKISSTSGGTYATSYVITYTGGSISATSVYVIFAPTSTGTFSGYITVTGGSGTENIYVSGSGCSECSGTPTGGTATATPSTGNSSTAFSISLSGYTSTVSGITFQWYSSPTSGGTYTAISGATNPTYNFTGISANMCYKCLLTCPTYGYTAYSSTACITFSGSSACSNIITTIMGNGTAGYSGDGGAATSAELNGPNWVISDASGNYYVSDGNNNRIRKMTPAGVITTIAGNGTGGFSGDGGAATAAELYQPSSIAFDAAGNLYIGDLNNNRIRKVNTSGIISTFAGNGTGGFSGDGGAATAAELASPYGLVFDAFGNLYCADEYNHRVRKITPAGIITTFAGNGSGTYSGDGGPATAASLNYPNGITVDLAGNILVLDNSNHRVRKINTSGIISTVAGTGTGGYTGDGGAATAAEINFGAGLASDHSGNMFISDAVNNRVRVVSASGIISTFAGNGTAGFSGDGGPATAAELNSILDVSFDNSGNILVADNGNSRIRKITTGFPIVAPISGPSTVSVGSTITLSDTTTGGTWSSASASIATVSSSGVVGGVAAGSALISYTVTNSCGTTVVIYGVTAYTTTCSNIITTVVGNGTGSYSGDGGAATSAELYSPTNVFVDGSGNIFISDYSNNRIRKVSSSGIITTIVGTGTAGYSGDGGPATAAELYGTNCTVFDGSGNMYIADYSNHRVRKVSTSGIITTVAGNGTGGYSGDGGAATSAELYYPSDVALDASGNLYITDEANNRVRKVNTSGIISTIAGTGATGYSGDGGAATAAELNRPGSLIFDASGNLYIADPQNERVRKINTSGIISTIAGNGTAGFSGDGGAATAAELNHPLRITLDASGNLYIGDGNNNRVRKVTTSGIISTIAGNGTASYSGDGGTPTAAELDLPAGISVDGSGNIFIADQGNNRIRKISSGAPVVGPISGPTTVSAGASITLSDTTTGGSWTSSSTGIATVSGGGVVYGVAAGSVTISYTVTNSCGSTAVIYSVTVSASSSSSCSIISTVAGSSTTGYGGDGGAATSADLNSPYGVAVDGTGNIYIADYNNHRIRKVNTSGIISTIGGTGTAGYSGDGGAATNAMMNYPIAVTVDAGGNVFIADYQNSRIRKINTSGIISTIAGNGTAGYSGDGGSAVSAEINYPQGIAVDGTGNVYVADAANNRIRLVNTSGNINTFAGNGTAGFAGDGGAATAAEISNPHGISLDASGNLYITDVSNNRIRKVTTSGNISTVAGNGTAGYSGDGGAATSATLRSPNYVSVDASNNLYIVDYANHVLRKVSSAGIISTIAGTGSAGFSGDGGAATSAQLHYPTAVAVDASGNLYIADEVNSRVRKIISGTPTVRSISGSATVCIGNYITLVDSTSGGTWSSSATSVASVNSSGVVTGLSAGSTTISYSVTNSCGTTVVTKTVTVANPSIAITGPSTVCVGTTITLTDSTSGGTWTSSAAGIASVNSSTGVVTGISAGSVNISYSVTTSCGTGGSIHTTITVLPLPATPTAITGPSIVCLGGTITLSDSTSGGTWSSSNVVVASVGSTGIVTGITDGSTIITYSFTNSCGTIYVTHAVTVSGSPATAGTIAGPTSDCVGASITLTDGTTGGTWTSSNSSIATVSSGIVLGVAAGSVIISYTVTNSCGSTSATYAVTIISTPTVAAISGPSMICNGSSGTFSDATGGGTWSCSAFTVATINASSGLAYGIAVGTTIVSYSVSNACGSTTTTASLTVSASPATPQPIRGTATVCVGATTNFTDTTTGGTWSSSNSSVVSVNSTGLVTGVAAGSATITYTVSNSCGSAFVVRAVSVSALPSVASISGTPTVCSGLTVTLSDGTSGGTWSSGSPGIASVNSSGTVTGVAVGSATISYSLTNSCGTTSSTIGFTVTTVPSVGAISGSSTICSGTSSTLSDGTSGGSWSSVTTSVATVNSGGTVFGVTAGTSTISYTVTNSCGSAAATKVVTISALPTAGTITGSTTVCTGTTTTLVDGTSGGTWTSSNSSVASVSSGGVVTGVSPGSAVITYSVTSSCGSAMTTASVTVNPSPNAGSVSGAATVCAGVTAILTDAASGGTWSSSSTSLATVSAAGVVTGVAAGSVTISYSVTNSCGTAVATHSMTINPAPNAGSITGPTVVCAGASITLADAAAGGTWSSSNAGIASVNSSGIVTGVAAGTAAISYSVTNSCGTATTGTVINVSGAPSAGTISGPTGVCTGTTITLTDGAIGGVWSSSNTAKATVTSSGVVFGVSAGSVTISYTVTSSCATVSAVSTITVSTSASAGTISGLSSVCTGATITLTTSGTAGGTWSSSNTSLASVSSGVVRGIAAGMVTISYSVTSGCGTVVSTKSVTVTATPSVTAISGASNICIGTSSTYTDATSGGGWISSNTAIATVNSAGLVTAISAGTATLTYFVTNTCGTATTTMSLTVSSLTAGVISGAASVAVGASTTLTNTVAGGVWSSVHTTLATINATGMVTGVAVGADSIKYSVTNVCGTANAYKIISITAHRDELPGNTVTQGEENTGINIFPNPSTGSFTLELTGFSGEATILITDLTGRTLTTKTTSEKSINFDLSNYAAGTYLVRVSVDGKVFGRKVVVNG